jgi:hypothetical protein
MITAQKMKKNELLISRKTRVTPTAAG